MPNDHEIPSREDLVHMWQQVIRGSVARERAHAWAATWVEDPRFDPSDGMILTGLQYLHGFDLVVDDHGGSDHSAVEFQGKYVKQDAEVEADLRHWLNESAMYDEDPARFLARKVAHALEMLKREERGGGA